MSFRFRQCSAGIQVIQAVLSWYPGHSESAQMISRSFRQWWASIQVIQAVLRWYPPFRQWSDGTCHSGSAQLVSRPFSQCSDGICHSGSAQLVSSPFKYCSAGIQVIQVVLIQCSTILAQKQEISKESRIFLSRGSTDAYLWKNLLIENLVCLCLHVKNDFVAPKLYVV